MSICPVCETELPERKYCDLIYCSLSCGNRGRARKNEIEYLKSPKPCKLCGETIPYRGRFRSVYCSHSCSATSNNRKRQVSKFCLGCFSLLRNNESTYCSQTCFEEKDYRDYIERWKSDKESGVIGNQGTSVRIKRYLRETRGNKCEECGWDKVNPITNRVPVQLEHRDGNWQNNAESNLRLLCPNCHSLTPTYGALNKGSGRKNRRQISKPGAPDGRVPLS